MPTFKYTAKVRGKNQDGEIDAENEKAATAILKQRKLKVVSLTPKRKDSKLLQSKQKITEKDVVLFTRQFTTMIDAGLPLVQCLDILAKQSENKSFCEVISVVKSNIEGGATLSDSMHKHPKVF